MLEEELWEHHAARSGTRHRPQNWAASAAEGQEDDLQPESWHRACCDFLKFLRSAIPAGGKTLRVCCGGLTLQDALALAENGDVVELAPGAYQQQIVLSRAITLVGAHRDCVEIGGVRVSPEAGGVVIASLTIASRSPSRQLTSAGESADEAAPPALHVIAGETHVMNCNIRGEKGILALGGVCKVSCCDIQVQQCCFCGTGELADCRLEGHKELTSGNDFGADTVLSLQSGYSTVKNCVVHGHGVDVGVWLHAGAKCEVEDSDIKALSYGVLVESSRSHAEVSRLMLHNCR